MLAFLLRRTSPAAPSLTPLSLWSASARVHNPAKGGRLRQRAKFFLRSLAQPRLTQAWLARLTQPDLAPLWAAHPRLASKLQRPYVHCEWRPLERIAALLGHYDTLPRVFSPDALAAIYGDGLRLMRLVHPGSGRQLDVQLAYRDQFEKEGELTLSLDDVATGLTLAGITFCLPRNGDLRLAIVGGLQASPDPRTRGLIHDVAKEMHGFRPKALVLWLLQELGAVWGLTQIQAVGDAHHIYRHWRKRREFAASYDEFWTESDGHQLAGGGWELPLRLKQRTREELKPNRRKQHERRYAMLSALRPALHTALAASARSAANDSAPVPASSPLEFMYASPEAATAAPTVTPACAEPVAHIAPALNHSF